MLDIRICYLKIGLRAVGASLWIHPALINLNTIDIAHGLNMSLESWRYMAFKHKIFLVS